MINITIQEVKDKKKEVEEQILGVVNRFREETGLAITDIDVQYFSTLKDEFAHPRVDVHVEDL